MRWQWLAVLAVLALGGFFVVEKTRGLRNKNPGNIRANTIVWDGQVGVDTAPGGPFAIFGDAKYGLRALARLLGNYERLYGLNTVRGIINRWAPDEENDTESYIKSVASAVGVGPDESFSVQARLPNLMKAIIKHENGLQPYSGELINEAIRMV